MLKWGNFVEINGGQVVMCHSNYFPRTGSLINERTFCLAEHPDGLGSAKVGIQLEQR